MPVEDASLEKPRLTAAGCTRARIAVTVAAETIYGDGLVKLTAIASHPFALSISGRAAGLKCGRSDVVEGMETITAGESGGHWVIEALVFGWIGWQVDEVSMREGRESDVEYSQRFYPYISSAIGGTLTVTGGGITAVDFEVPEDCRPLRHHDVFVEDENGTQAECVDARHGQGWVWRFAWSDDAGKKSISFRIPVTIGAPLLATLTGTAALSLLVGTAGLAVAAAIAPSYVVVSTVLAALGILLGRWAVADRPHHFTLLTAIYLVVALTTVGWALAAEAGGWWLVAAIPPTLLASYLLWLNAYFEAVGGLPLKLARVWSHVSERLHDRRERTRSGIREEWQRSGPRRSWRPGGRATTESAERTRLFDNKRYP
jgi:hypothetical protein